MFSALLYQGQGISAAQKERKKGLALTPARAILPGLLAKKIGEA